MNLGAFRRLLTPEGQAALDLAARLPDSPPLARVEGLRRRFPPALAQAAAEMHALRRRAAVKFSRADGLYFTGDGLEQASAEPVARLRARRFEGHRLTLDLGCGIGGDALALAAAAPLIAIDRLPLHAEIARANLAVCGPAESARVAVADVTRLRLPGGADALFLDPARREGGRRTFDPERYSPPLTFAAELAATGRDLAVKVAPGIDWRRLPFACEVEVVSLEGDVKEAVLWGNGFATAPRRATLLPSGATLAGGDPEPDAPVQMPRRYLFEPDGAVIRAGLVRHLATCLDAALIDPEIAYLTADSPVPTPFGRWLRLDQMLPFGQKRIAARLRALGVGRPVVKKRGSPLDPERFAEAVRGPGERGATVVLTRLGGRPWALICDLT